MHGESSGRMCGGEVGRQARLHAVSGWPGDRAGRKASGGSRKSPVQAPGGGVEKGRWGRRVGSSQKQWGLKKPQGSGCWVALEAGQGPLLADCAQVGRE